ncbi:ABC transporter permease [candidate division KSB1 bacterium]
MGDIEQDYFEILHKRGGFRALIWLWMQMLKSIPGGISNMINNNFALFKNYLKIALRNIKRNKSLTFINVSGFTAGIVICLFIMLYVQFELSYEDFVENADEVYRVALERSYPGYERHIGGQSPALATVLKRNYPEIHYATSVIIFDIGRSQVSYLDNKLLEDRVYFADNDFFKVFPVKFIEGDPETALENPNTVVITEKMAEKYFKGEEPIGKDLIIRNNWVNDLSCTVTGVIEDIPQNSHFHYDFMISFKSTPLTRLREDNYIVAGWYALTYIRLNPESIPGILESKFHDLVLEYFGPSIQESNQMSVDEYFALGNRYRYYLQALQDIHLKSNIEEELEPDGNVIYVYMYSIIAVIVLLIACINFMNLSTARSLTRAREVGIRKAIGSYRRDLIKQFLVESVFLSLISLSLAVISAKLLLPVFNSFTGKEIHLNYFDNAYFLPGLVLFSIVIGLLSGSYPAFFLSSFHPVSVLKGKLRAGSGKSTLRNILVVFQFTSSIALIAGTLIIKDQIDFMLNKDIGYDKDNVIVLENGRAVAEQVEAFKTELKNNPEIINAAVSYNYPGSALHYFSINRTGGTGEGMVTLFNTGGDIDLIETLGMQIVMGRKYIDTDSAKTIINESAVRALELDDPIGQELTRGRIIIGVVKDFHFRSMHRDIRPFMLNYFEPGSARVCNYIAVRINPENIPGTISYIHETWERFSDGAEFSYTFLDEKVREWYINEEKTKKTTGVFSALAVFIGCLGLFGLALFSAEQRTKEIGIRKVMGATVPAILINFAGNFTRLIGIAFIAAVPITYYLMSRWLENFAYRIDIGFYTFLFVGILVTFISILTVSYQSLKVAGSNPVDSLRYE